MPYDIVPDSADCPADRTFAVINAQTKRKHGCHPTREAARMQQKALYAAENGGMKKSLFDAVGDFLKEIAGLVPGPESDVVFYEIGEIPEMGTPDEDAPFSMEELRKEQHKRIRGVDYTADDFAIRRDANRPQTWGILLADGSPAKITEQSLKRAAALLTPGTDTFKALSLSEQELTSAKRIIRAHLQRLSIAPDKWPSTIVKEVSFLLKETPDGLRWFAVYSNNALDTSNPPDLLSNRAHQAFAYLTKEGLAAMPELWVWHLPHTRLGIADLVDVSDGVAYATGLIDADAEKHALLLEKMGPLGVSHGMPYSSVLRNADDPRVIDFYLSREISVLPAARAANPFTSFVTFTNQGETMLTTDQRKALLDLQFDEARVAQIEQTLEAKSDEADKAGVQRKEAGTDASTEVNVVPEYVTRPQLEEMIGVLKGQFEAIQARLDASDASAADLQKGLADLAKADAVKVAEKAAMTPPASLSDLYKQLAITSPLAVVKAKDPVAKDGPAETAAPVQPITGISYIDNIIGPRLAS